MTSTPQAPRATNATLYNTLKNNLQYLDNNGIKYIPVLIKYKPNGNKIFRPLVKNFTKLSDEEYNKNHNLYKNKILNNTKCYAIMTGVDFDVVDVDNHGENGIPIFEEKFGAISSFPFVVETPGNGYHIYFKKTGLKSKACINGVPIDTRGTGGLIVGPGSYPSDTKCYSTTSLFGDIPKLDDYPLLNKWLKEAGIYDIGGSKSNGTKSNNIPFKEPIDCDRQLSSFISDRLNRNITVNNIVDRLNNTIIVNTNQCCINADHTVSNSTQSGVIINTESCTCVSNCFVCGTSRIYLNLQEKYDLFKLLNNGEEPNWLELFNEIDLNKLCPEILPIIMNRITVPGIKSDIAFKQLVDFTGITSAKWNKRTKKVVLSIPSNKYAAVLTKYPNTVFTALTEKVYSGITCNCGSTSCELVLKKSELYLNCDNCGVKWYYFDDISSEMPADIVENFIENIDYSDFGDLNYQSGMGTSKTVCLGNYLRESSVANKSVLCITYRQTLSKKFKGDFNEFYNYLDGGELIDEEKLIICWNSLGRLVNREDFHYDIVVIDEIDSLLSSLTCSYVADQDRCIEILCKIIKKTGKFISLDAKALNRRTVEFITALRPDISLIKNTFIRPSNRTCIIKKVSGKAGLRKLIEEVLECAKLGKRALIPTTTSTAVYEIQDAIKERFPNKVVKIYTGETNKDDPNGDDIINVNTEWCKCDFVIYSSAIPSAISFQVSHFHKLIGWSSISRDTAKCNDFLQQLFRARMLIDGEMIIYEATSKQSVSVCKESIVADYEDKYRLFNKETRENPLININKDTGIFESINTNDLITNLFFNNIVEENKSLRDPIRYYTEELNLYYSIPVKVIIVKCERGEAVEQEDTDFEKLRDLSYLEELTKKKVRDYDRNDRIINTIDLVCCSGNIDREQLINTVIASKECNKSLEKLACNTVYDIKKKINLMKKTPEELDASVSNLETGSVFKAVYFTEKNGEVFFEKMRRSIVSGFNGTVVGVKELPRVVSSIFTDNSINTGNWKAFCKAIGVNRKFYKMRFNELSTRQYKHILEKIAGKCWNGSNDVIDCIIDAKNKSVIGISINNELYSRLSSDLQLPIDTEYYFDDSLDN